MRKLIFTFIMIIISHQSWGQTVNLPPPKPIVHAVMGDCKVTLYWDERAEQIEDFEGYIIFRSTEPSFKEVQKITDGFGNPTLYMPIAQFDKKDGIKGVHPIAINGIKFHLGDDSGLVNTWIDSGAVPKFSIVNGQTYYYAVCSYDYGDSTLGLAPGISNLDDNFNFIFDDSNTVAVTPNVPPLGYIPPELECDYRTSQGMVYFEFINTDSKEVEDFTYKIHRGDFFQPKSGPGTGLISVEIIDPTKLKSDHIYQVTFQDTGLFHETISYSVYDATIQDTVVKRSRHLHSKDIQEVLIVRNEIQDYIGAAKEFRKLGPVFDGLSITVFNHQQVFYIDSLTEWIVGDCNYIVDVEFDPDANFQIAYPADYEIRFYDHIVDSSLNGSIPTNFEVWNVTDSLKCDFIFRDRDRNSLISPGDFIGPALYLDSGYKRPCRIYFYAPSPTEELIDGNYLELDGIDDYALAEDDPSLDIATKEGESLTVEAWIYPQNKGGYIVADEGYALSVISGSPSGIKFDVWGGGLLHTISKTDFNFRLDEWHHVVGIFDNAANKLAVGFDGEILISDQDTTTFNLRDMDTPLYIGSFDETKDFFDGAIDEIRISNVVRYTNTTYVPDTTFSVDAYTKALWHFNEPAESALFNDTSAYSNTLTGYNDTKAGPIIQIAPEAGDIFRAHCTKPFRRSWINENGVTLAGDLIEFQVQGAFSDKTLIKNSLDEIAVVPNPYCATASWESDNGERKIYFIHLPPKVTIRIYTISGYLVDTLEHNNQSNDGTELWNLKSSHDEDIAYGIYIYHVDIPGIGQKIGKFAVIK